MRWWPLLVADEAIPSKWKWPICKLDQINSTLMNIKYTRRQKNTTSVGIVPKPNGKIVQRGKHCYP